MPYKIRKQGGKYTLIKKTTGKKVSTHDSLKKASMAAHIRNRGHKGY